MTERFRALLDDAASTLEPADPDPVPAIVARGRAARRRRVTAGALAMLVLTGLAVAAGVRMSADDGPVVPTAAARPPVPRVVGRVIVAGDVTVPVPDGWKVAVGSPKAPCGKLEKTVLIFGFDSKRCQYAAIQVSGTFASTAPGFGVYVDQSMVTSPPAVVTLRGGAPGWLAEPVDAEANDPKGKPAGYGFSNTLRMPWSKVEVTLSVPGPLQKQIVDSISVAPSPRAGRLALQDQVLSAVYIRPGAPGAEPVGGRLSGAETIEPVLRLLRAQHETVDARHACTRPGLPIARLTLSSLDPDPYPTAGTTLVQIAETDVIISLGDCHEAVSSNGGRVRLSPHTVETLERLFGIPAR